MLSADMVTVGEIGRGGRSAESREDEGEGMRGVKARQGYALGVPDLIEILQVSRKSCYCVCDSGRLRNKREE